MRSKMLIEVLAVVCVLHAASCNERQRSVKGPPGKSPTVDRSAAIPQQTILGQPAGDVRPSEPPVLQPVTQRSNVEGEIRVPSSPPESGSGVTAKEALARGLRAAEGGDLPTAVKHWQQALTTYETLPDSEHDQAACCMNIGAALVDLLRFDEALKYNKSAVALFTKGRADDRTLAGAHQNLGVTLAQLRRHAEAIEELKKALALWEKVPGSGEKQMQCVARIALCEEFQEADTEDDQAKSREFVAKCLTRAAGEMWQMGQFQEALQKQNEALAIYERLPGQESGQAVCLNNLGNVFCSLGEPAEAILRYKRSLALYDRIPNTERQRAQCMRSMGDALQMSGRYEEGMQAYEQASTLFATREDATQDRAGCAQNLGIALGRLGRHEQAIGRFEEALAVFKCLRQTEHLQIGCQVNIAVSLTLSGRAEEAVDTFRQVQDSLVRLTASEREQGECQMNLGEALLECGRYDDALESQERALSLLGRVAGTERQRAVVRGGMARTLTALGKFREASDALSHVDIDWWWVDEARARAAEGAGRTEGFWAAEKHQARAIAQVEHERALVRDSDYRMSWLEDKAVVYEHMARLQVRMQQSGVPEEGMPAPLGDNRRVEAGVIFSDVGKGRTLLELMSHRATRTDDRSTPEALAVLKIFNLPEFIKSVQVGEACLEYVACEKELLIFLVSWDGVKAFRVEIARDVSRELREKGRPSIERLVAAYRRAPNRPDTLSLEGLVWLQREWMDHWEKEKRLLSEKEHVAISRALAQVLLPSELRQALVTAKVKHLVIVPSRVLAFTSFATLVTGPKQGEGVSTTVSESRFLIEDYSVSYVQSLSLLTPIRKRAAEKHQKVPPKPEFLAFAHPIHDDNDRRSLEPMPEVELAQPERDRVGVDAVVHALVRDVMIASDASISARWPQLKETQLEAESVAALFGEHTTYESPILRLPQNGPSSVVCVGYAANRPLACSPDVGQARHLLFSVHGHTDMATPWLSSLMLTDLAGKPGTRQPALLTMADVFAMELKADTVVLAACQTAMGRMRAGEGVIGFQLAFLFAGADTVVLTEWDVPSTIEAQPGGKTVYPTTDVITRFYHDLRLGKVTRAEALRQGQLAVLRQGGQLADPFFWGAWQLFGEWRDVAAVTPSVIRLEPASLSHDRVGIGRLAE